VTLLVFYAFVAVHLFVTVSGFGQAVKYVEFPKYLRSAESDAQMYTPSLLCRSNIGWNGAQLRRHGPHIRYEIRQGDWTVPLSVLYWNIISTCNNWLSQQQHAFPYPLFIWRYTLQLFNRILSLLETWQLCVSDSPNIRIVLIEVTKHESCIWKPANVIQRLNTADWDLFAFCQELTKGNAVVPYK